MTNHSYRCSSDTINFSTTAISFSAITQTPKPKCHYVQFAMDMDHYFGSGVFYSRTDWNIPKIVNKVLSRRSIYFIKNMKCGKVIFNNSLLNGPGCFDRTLQIKHQISG